MPAKQPAGVSPAERVQNFYKKLNAVAKELNSASDGLKEAVSVLDAALHRLNLGVSAWVVLGSSDGDGQGEWWDRRIGYAKVGKDWRIALSYRRGNYQWPEDDRVEEWAFDDAPRWMRIESLAKIPELLEALITQAQEMASKMKNTTEHVLELGAAMSKALDEVEAQQKAAGNA